MKTIILNFLDKWSGRIVLPLVLIMFFKTCSTNGNIEKLEKRMNSKIETEAVSKEEVQKMLTIEGLKSEKRMIQSTDRKILDVNRQSEIDKEIQSLETK